MTGLELGDSLDIDVDVISVYTYEDQVVIAFIDKEGEHGAVMDSDGAEKLAESLVSAATMAREGEGMMHVN